ncbi:squalene epoxidase-domain-containing protein [Paraphysoderma sedebokerense]|nr:squalene epoxidase-domain-containing protein [Paraphysoderma sedebokerense]
MVAHQLSEKNYDVIIVGAGVAGSALAFALGKDGRRVLLIERDMSQPDRIVGELLQPGGCLALESLGLANCTSNIDAIDVHGYTIFNHNDTCQLTYPENDDGTKPIGKSFHHGRFIMALRESCKKIANVTILEATVTDLIKDSSSDCVIGVSSTRKIKETEDEAFSSIDTASIDMKFHAPITVVADGCFSKFRKEYITATPKTRSHFVGFILDDCPLPYPNYGHVILANPSPVLMYQIGTHDTRVLVDVPGKIPSAKDGGLKRYMEQVVSPQIPTVIRSSFLKALTNQRLRVMPNSFLRPTKQTNAGVIFLGDSQNMRHPLTGGGMTVALSDVVLLRSLLSTSRFSTFEGKQDEIVQVCKQWYWKRKGLSSVVNILAMALYDLFSAGDDDDLKILRRATFNYLNLGGRFTSDPVGLLAGILPRPLLLITHFFSVAAYGAYDLFSHEPWYMLPRTLWKGVRALWKATQVMAPLVWSEIRGGL